jgi:hypothetical protein
MGEHGTEEAADACGGEHGGGFAERPGVSTAPATPAVPEHALERLLPEGYPNRWWPPRYDVEIGRSTVQVVRHGLVGDRGRRHYSGWTRWGELVEVEIGGGFTDGVQRGDQGLSYRSGANMRRRFTSLPWERLERPALISLTYPGDWRRWVPSGRHLERHRTMFRRAWLRRWGEPIAGAWVKEFQQRGAPHLHLYVGLPAAVTGEEMEALRRRAIEGKWLEGVHGVHKGRSMLHWGRWAGDFVPWLRTTWAEIVGTQGITNRHHGRGVDVRVFFFTEAEEKAANRQQVAEYLTAEVSKRRQKTPPEDFVGVGRYWGHWSGAIGFVPEVQKVYMDWRVAYEFQRRLARWVRLKLRARGRPLENFERRRDGDGVTAYGLGREDTLRLLRWSEDAVARAVERRGMWVPRGHRFCEGGELPVQPSVDAKTGQPLVVRDQSRTEEALSSTSVSIGSR